MVRDKKLYETLGVAVDANENDIKKAYKKGALKYHPDKNKDNEDAAEKFKDLSQAYEILSDTEKRKTYDLHGLDYILRGGASEPEPSSSEPRSSRSQTPRFQREDSYPFTSSGSSRTPGSSGHARNYSFSGSFSHTPSDPFRTFDTFMKRHASARMEDDFGFSDRGSPMGGGPGHHSMPGMGSPLPDQGIHGSPYPRSSRHRTERRDHPRPEREPSGRFEDRDKTRGLSDRERDYGDLKVNGKFSTARSHTSGRTHKGSPVAEKPMDLTLEEMFRGVNKKVRVKRKTFDEDGKAQNVDKVVYLVAKPGVKAGDYIKLPEAGDETEDGRVPDLYVIAGEKAHDRFKREGDDLITSIDIDLKDALLGWTNTVTNIEEHKLPISHPGPTPPTWTETFPGHGMRKGKGKEDRDQIPHYINNGTEK